MQIIQQYFPNINEHQAEQFAKLEPLYKEWNEKINVISRKDIDNLYERHILHSLGIAKFFNFPSGSKVLDIGTGGGFPGIPLAILFPEVQWVLVDSIGKKIKVVNAVAEGIGLQNVEGIHSRAEKAPGPFDYAVTRAVAPLPKLFYWTKKSLRKTPKGQEFRHGLICLKGGDLKEELEGFNKHVRFFNLKDVFEEEFYETKKVVYVPYS